MHKLKQVVTIAGMAALLGAAMPVFAEAAPVFDVDTFESGSDQQDQDLQMPPAPGEESAAKSAPEPAQAMAVGARAGSEIPDESVATPDAASKSAPIPKSVGVVQRDAASAPMPTENLTPEERMHRLEQQIANLQSSQSAAQVESLQTEVQSLRGQLEQMTHEVEKMRVQEKAQVADSKPASAAVGNPDTSVLESSDTPEPKGAVVAKKAKAKKKPHVSEADAFSEAESKTEASVASTGKDQPNVAEEQQIYQTAYDLIKAKKYNEAVTALQGMLKKYPTGQFASNAHYWLGELYGLMSKHDHALDEFNTVITKFPDSPRVSDAELKVGLILAAQSKWSDAKKAFKKVINTYPGTASARLASEQLKQIKLAGH